MKLNFKAVWLNLRRQPVISTVTIIGTALAIFLIMVMVMISEVRTASIAPESNRSRTLYNTWTSIKSTENEFFSSNGPMSYDTFKSIFGNMKTPEAVTAYIQYSARALANEAGAVPKAVEMRQIDDMFWKVFDYDFVGGHPFGKAEFDAGLPVAVITENTARAIFGTTDVIGREFRLNYLPYIVCGVIRDVSQLSWRTYGHVFVPFTSQDQYMNTWNENIMGQLSAAMLAHDAEDFDAIRSEYLANLARYNKEIAPTNWAVLTLNRPYDSYKEAEVNCSNNEPDMDAARMRRLVIYLILLIVPAVNLSSMTESRLRGRTAEIGVRRAFGCTRYETLMMILGENLIVTMMAGIIGLALSVGYALIAQDFLFGLNDSGDIHAARVGLSSLIHMSTFLWALIFCFILNLLSSGIPAWRASRLNIVNAISGLRK